MTDPTNADIIADARVAFGHIEGRSDVGVLCLRVRQLDRMCQERLAHIRSQHEQIKRLEIAIRALRKQAARSEGISND